MKDLFTGALGRLNNHGGSRIYTTPNTILVPPEYEIEIGEHGIFISCSLDGRLWLFEDRIIALKWNKEAGKMEYATSKSFSDENFVARGRDWILTDKSVIQITDSSPYIFHETHNENVTPMEHFYSLLPALDGFQIVKNYLIRKPDADYENLMYHISMPDIYLTFYGNTIWARNNLGIGTVNILNNEGVYSLNFNYSHNFSDNSWQNMGIAFIDEKIYGFKNKENNKSLCPCSENNQLYSLENSSWSNVSDNEGNIFFDPFNRSGIMIDNKGINFLASNKSIECKTLSQWIAPAKQIQSIDDNAIISSINNSVLATYINLGFYRGLLPQKTLQLTTQAYEKDNDFFRLSLGIQNNTILKANKIIFIPKDNGININIRLLNIFEHAIERNPYEYSEQENYAYRPYDVYFASYKYLTYITLDNSKFKILNNQAMFLININTMDREKFSKNVARAKADFSSYCYDGFNYIETYREWPDVDGYEYLLYVNVSKGNHPYYGFFAELEDMGANYDGNFNTWYSESWARDREMYISERMVDYFTINPDTGTFIDYNTSMSVGDNVKVVHSADSDYTEVAPESRFYRTYRTVIHNGFIYLFYDDTYDNTSLKEYPGTHIPTDWQQFFIKDTSRYIALEDIRDKDLMSGYPENWYAGYHTYCNINPEDIFFHVKDNGVDTFIPCQFTTDALDLFNEELIIVTIMNYLNPNIPNEFLHILICQKKEIWEEIEYDSLEVTYSKNIFFVFRTKFN